MALDDHGFAFDNGFLRNRKRQPKIDGILREIREVHRLMQYWDRTLYIFLENSIIVSSDTLIVQIWCLINKS